MPPGKLRRGRRDSFGLEVRKDGTLIFDFKGSSPGEVSALPVTRKAPPVKRIIEKERTGGSKTTPPQQPKPQKGNPPQKLIKRRDSFGLEVRADGTLSLDQLVKRDHEPRTSEAARARRVGRTQSEDTEAQGQTVIGSGDQSERRSRNMATVQGTGHSHQPTNQRDWGSGGSDLRHLRPRNSPSNLPGRDHREPSACPQPAAAQRGTRNPANAPRAVVSASRRQPHEVNNRTAAEVVQSDSSEVRALREQVRRLEDALAQQNQSSAQNGDNTAAPPAYESRPNSPGP